MANKTEFLSIAAAVITIAPGPVSAASRYKRVLAAPRAAPLPIPAGLRRLKNSVRVTLLLDKVPEQVRRLFQLGTMHPNR
jgi:hypothetical protein